MRKGNVATSFYHCPRRSLFTVYRRVARGLWKVVVDALARAEIYDVLEAMPVKPAVRTVLHFVMDGQYATAAELSNGCPR